MLKIGIIGCGKIADDHAEQISYIPGCEIVAVCDREELMARQLQERLGRGAAFTDVREMLHRAKPDVVHITTPPQTHFAIGKMCLEAGAHIYVEKPFTIFHEEARELLDIAERVRRKLTVGHNAQFSRAANKVRTLIAGGYLGGAPVHMESYYCYDLGDAAYAKALLSDPYHWVRNLPGGLLQNTISHGISKAAEYLRSDTPEVITLGFTSQFLRNIGESSIYDELRVTLCDGSTTAYFTFSSQMRPLQHALRVFGPKNGLWMDEQQQTVIKMGGQRYKSYLDQFIPPLNQGKQYIGNSLTNLNKFLRAKLHGLYGMRFLIESLYHSISNDGPVPIPYPEILRTSYIMEKIISQLNAPYATAAGDRQPVSLVER
jgi:predicted dehydrogenase